MYMDVPGSSTSNGTKIIQHQYNGGHENQQWILIKHEDGYYSIKNVNSNLNLDIPGDSKNSGVPLIQFTEHNNGN